MMTQPTLMLLAVLLLGGTALGDVIWRGTGTVTNAGSRIDTTPGETVSWSIRYGESALTDDFDVHALRLSIEFVISPSQTLRLDSPNKQIDGIGQAFVNWSLNDGDDLSYTEFPAESTSTVMTLRLDGDGNVVDGLTYADLRKPSFDAVEDFFGYVSSGSGGFLWFNVDLDSIEVYEVLQESLLSISFPEPGGIDLEWQVSDEALYRVETSPDLVTFFELHEERHTPDDGEFEERNITAPIRFYRVLKLNQVFPQ